LSIAYFRSHDVVDIARNLIGKVLISTINGSPVSGIITETEAYHQSEKACHAYDGRLTARTEVLFDSGGKSYVYLCYGIHYLFNVTTGPLGEASAVLIRALKPLNGIPEMLNRRGMSKLEPKLTAGPGNLTKALGIGMVNNSLELIENNQLWIESFESIPKSKVGSSSRIGVDYAQEDALLPWRFYLKDSIWVSKLKSWK